MSKHDPHDVVRTLQRNDLASFIQYAFSVVSPGSVYRHNWHIVAIAEYLQALERGEVRRLIITMPPRSLKSISVSVAFPAWLLGRDPRLRLIAASYAEDLSLSLARDCLRVMNSKRYQEIFPLTRIAPDLRGRRDFATTKGGRRFSTSVGGTLTGLGGNYLFIDDPHKPSEVESDAKRNAVLDWYRNTLVTRADDPTSARTVLVQQRTHEMDLAGHLLEQGDWEHLNLPAIAEEPKVYDLGRLGLRAVKEGELLHPERLPQRVLDRIKNELGSYNFAAQYQQRPAPLEGGIVKWNWFKTYDTPPTTGRLVQSWDTATSAGEANDYSVCTTWRVTHNEAWLVDLVREKMEFPELFRRVLAEKEKWGATAVLIERAGSGISLIQELYQKSNYSIVGRVPKGDKPTRLLGVSHAIEAGRVNIPKEAPWLAEFRRELMLFPNGKHDDQVDSLSQFLAWFLEPKATAVSTTQG